MNVLLIEADQWPWFCLSLAGSRNVHTPVLDDLARAGGVSFDNATCQSPCCMPSRLSTLSGRYVSSTKQFGFAGYCQRGIDWMQNVFKAAGYTTGAFGKMHALSVGLDDWGFDISAPTLPEENDLARPAGNTYREYCRRHGLTWPTDQMHGHDPWGGIAGSHGARLAPITLSSHADPKLTFLEQCAAMSDVPLEHSLERWTTDRAIDFITNCARSTQPFFAWVTYDRPHFPTTLPRELFDKLRPERIHLDDPPDVAALTGLPRHLFDCFAKGSSIFRLGGKRFRHLLATYYALIEYIDSEIGRLLKALSSSGDDGQTLIVFTADHGDEAGYNGLYDKNRRVSSEAVTHVPLIMRPPTGLLKRGLAGTTIDAPIELIDIFPTACAMAGVPIPPGVEGRNLAPALTGRDSFDQQRPVFCEDYWKRMVKKDGWKLVFDMTTESECLLYNMADDPRQLRNHYAQPQHARRRIELKRNLLSFLSQRIFGSYTEFDRDLLQRGMDPDDPIVPPNNWTNDPSPQLCFHRAGIFIKEADKHDLFVPFYPEGQIMLFGPAAPPRDFHRTRDQALPWDSTAIERLLNIGLRRAMSMMPTVSIVFYREPVEAPVSTTEEAQALFAPS